MMVSEPEEAPAKAPSEDAVSWLDAAKKWIARENARALLKLSWQKSIWSTAHSRHKFKAEAICWLAIAGMSAFAVWFGKDVSEAFYSDAARLEALETVIVTVGGALIGGAAIAASFILFAMQVNVERLPFGLFKRLSADRRLVSAVGATFIVALALSFLSVLTTSENSAVMIAAMLLGTIIILRLFVYSYGRSLNLISPTTQLDMIAADVRRSLRTWDRRARWASLLMKGEPSSDVRHDVRRLAFQKLNPHWTREVVKGIKHTLALARRAGELGDGEVSNAAFSTLIAANQMYVASKGKTFFSNNAFIENPLVTDAVVNETLEQLRRMYRGALGRADEEQVGLILSTFRALAETYLTIDYGDDHSLKTHAQLAGAYLQNDVEAIVPHEMVDVLMHGVREIGKLAISFVRQGRPEEVVGLAEKIQLIGVVGAVRNDHRAVLLTSVEQLALITFELIRVQDNDIRYAVGRLRELVNGIAKLFLEVPDTPLTSAHSTYLGPYFSSTSPAALRIRLTHLVNAVANETEGSPDARRVIRNVVTWADGLFESQKELLLLAVAKRSHFTFDMVHWITGITDLLLALSNADSCPKIAREDLQKHASWLAMTLSWLPRDPEAVAFLETFDITETYFSVAIDAFTRGADELANDMQKQLIRWGIEAGPLDTGWSILEQSIYGLAVLGLTRDLVEVSKTQLLDALGKDGPWNQPVRDSAARRIRTKAESLEHSDFEFRTFEHAMQQMDQDHLRKLLHELANILSPNTMDEPIQYPW